ncbi:lactoylglutathione lyase [Sphingomonas sinipercae]|uniref:Lactoylglutathione lyase n=1 Tax=Sphingomonas sinipercae TaxID=2714944 RepID=A0A6G7ZLC4_9SPHN|nr:VOC family protein [Sphingomonas sinipercae]QIL01725.1 lactoylglutathione lyase [Sphingomonas sinipercae]
MARMIFVNLPVQDLDRSIRFYEAIGARKEPKFSNDVAAMMVLSDAIHVMLLTHPFYSSFTSKQIADAHATSQVLLCLSAESREQVDEIVAAAGDSGGKIDQGLKQDQNAMMYGRDFEDPDGHGWEVMWMDPAFAEAGAHDCEPVEA